MKRPRKNAPARGVPVTADAVPLASCRIGDLVSVVERIPYYGHALTFCPGTLLRVTGSLAGGVLVRLVVDGEESRDPVVVGGLVLVRVVESKVTGVGSSAEVVDPVGGAE